MIWCQGFSEPNAGSDLASLRTQARIDGDHLVVNGSKIWTSHGHLSDWQELLVRTDPDAPKHKGISWVICDMKSPGITLRPIEIMTSPNQVHFVQCFYDDVRIPLGNVVGADQRRLERRDVDAGLRARHGSDPRSDPLRLPGREDDRARRANASAATRPCRNDEIGARLAQLRADMAAARAMTYMVMSRHRPGSRTRRAP